MSVLLRENLQVRATAGSSEVTYTTDPGRLAIDRLGSDTIRIEIPPAAPHVEIRAGGLTVLMKEGNQVRIGATIREGSGPFLIPLESPTP